MAVGVEEDVVGLHVPMNVTELVNRGDGQYLRRWKTQPVDEHERHAGRRTDSTTALSQREVQRDKIHSQRGYRLTEPETMLCRVIATKNHNLQILVAKKV